MSLQHALQPRSAAPAAIDPDDFVAVVDNPYFTLQPGTTFSYASRDGTSTNDFVVTRQTEEILGVTCVVVRDTAFEDGELVERTRDYFAQDKEGNVWYFGEDTAEIENGKVVSTAGTWRAGVNGAEPGIIMEAHPRVGDFYNQENAPGVAEDQARVLALSASARSAYGVFHDALRTADFTPLEPDLLEHKFYVKGVGQVLTLDRNTGEVEELLSIRVNGTNQNDALFGYAGGDSMSGGAGNDDLDGRAGADTIFGGFGSDDLDGGKDRVRDQLNAGEGGDRIRVALHDRAFGDAGNDLFLLVNNLGFGSIDGGRQTAAGVATHRADVVQFNGILNLTGAAGARITGIETFSMTDGTGNDSLRISISDVLDLGGGIFNPTLSGADSLREDDALRVEGDASDRLTLIGDWDEVAASNVPSGFDLFSADASSGHAYVLVQEDVAVVVV
jgi:hypothetical protein